MAPNVTPVSATLATPSLSSMSSDNAFAYPFFHYPPPIDVEDLSEYANGSLFPVHLGDIFSSSRSSYQILLKIGHGSYSTVWLGRDLNDDDRFVALKFLTAGSRGDSEVEILQWIQEHKHDHPGHRYTLQMLDNFTVGEPYPTHNVVVANLLIPLIELPGQIKEKLLPTKQACRQLMQGLAFLHGQGITHGDLHQGNLALRVSISFPGSMNDFMNTVGLPPDIVPVLRNVRKPSNIALWFDDEDQSKHLPKYQVTNSLFEDFVRYLIKSDAFGSTGVELQIIDFSNSYRGPPPTPLPTTHARVRAPEIFASKVSSAVIKCGGVESDIWSAACSMFEIACHGILLESYGRITKSVLFEEIVQKIGPLPDSWQLMEISSVQSTSTASPDQFWEECLSKRNTFQQDADARGCFSLLRRMLQVDPDSRPSAELLCKDQWLEDSEGDGVNTDSGAQL